MIEFICLNLKQIMFRAWTTKIITRLSHSHSKSFSGFSSGCGSSYGSCQCLEKLNQMHRDLVKSTTTIIVLISCGIILQGLHFTNTNAKIKEKN